MSAPSQQCPLSKQELLEDKKLGLGLNDFCPLCQDLHAAVKVGFHKERTAASSSSASAPVPRFTSEQLLLLARPGLLAAQASDWVIRLARLFPNEMNMATRDQSVPHMRALCDRFEQQPRSTTIRIFHEQGIALGDPLHNAGNAVLYHGTRETTPLILKKLDDPFELKGYQAIEKLDATQRRNHHLAPFNLFKAVSPISTPAPTSPGDSKAGTSVAAPSVPSSSVSSAGLSLSGASIDDVPPQGSALPRTPVKPSQPAASLPSISASSVAQSVHFCSSSSHSPVSRDWVSMPHYPTTLDGFARPLSSAAVSKLISQLLSALDFLHQSNLAHMDVKPSNIFVDPSGDFWLADFGSVRQVGTPSPSTTPTFLPGELREPPLQAYVASQQHDYWMLAMTVTDMLTARPEDGVGAGPTDPSRSQVLHVLTELSTQAATQLRTRIE